MKQKQRTDLVKMRYAKCWEDQLISDLEAEDPWEEDPEIQESLSYHRSKRNEKIKAIQEANYFVDNLFERKFAPKIFKELEFKMDVDRVTKVRKLEAVLSTGLLLQMRARVPGRIIRLAYEINNIHVPGKETGDTDEIELTIRKVQRKERESKPNGADVKRRRHLF